MLYGTQHPTDLFDDLLRESWENQVKAQPGVNHAMLVCRRQSPRGRRRQAWCSCELLCLPARVAAGPVLDTRPGEVVITRGAFLHVVVVFLLHVLLNVTSVKVARRLTFIILKLVHFHKTSLAYFPPTFYKN